MLGCPEGASGIQHDHGLDLGQPFVSPNGVGLSFVVGRGGQ
jgi:hypothetical protein